MAWHGMAWNDYYQRGYHFQPEYKNIEGIQ